MKRTAIRRSVVVCLALVALAPLVAARQQQAAASRPATDNDLLRRIFATREFAPRRGPQPAWFESGASFVVVEPATGEPRGEAVVKYDTATGARREVLITPGQLTPQGRTAPVAIEDLSWSADNRRVLVFSNSRRAWRTNAYGDYWVLDRTAGTLRKIGGDAPEASLMYAAFSPDATKVAYVRQNDLYVEDIATGAIRRLTEDGGDLVINGAGDWVNEEELSIHDAFRWSPDSRRIAYWQFDLHGVGNFALTYYLGKTRSIVTSVPYPQTGPYPVTMNIPYPLAGTTNSAVRVGVVGVDGGPTTWARLPGDPRENYVSLVQWLDPTRVLIEQLNRLQNTLTLRVAQAESGAARDLWRDHDEAFLNTRATGLEDPRRIGRADLLVTSEKDGWQHVYRISSDGREKLVTPGAMDVVSVAGVDEARNLIYFIASPDNATERYLYRAPLDGSADPTRVTPASWKGTNGYNVSPDGRYAFHSFSSFDDPGIREVVALPDHRVLRVTDDNAALKKAVAELVKPPVEYFKVDAGGGVTVDGYLLEPPGFDPSKKYPVLVNIYGEPAGQTVTNRWGGQGALFHRYIASLGYLVASFDNSGTPAPRGRAWRKSIYGAVGVLSSEQQAQALRSLASTHSFVDLDRVAVWGWSGGGTNTLNLMFRHPELYKVGMSVASVPDQRLYDSIYQERYMGLPQSNTAGYEKASAINYADGLTGHLLIVHGSGDDNVHYQGAELLVNRLIELGKPFDFMTYPDRTHAISEGSGTSIHLYRLLTRYLTEHLPAGPRSPATQGAAQSKPAELAAAAQTKPESWLTSTKLAEGVWRIDDNGSDNMYLVEGKDKALLIDTGLGTARLADHVRTLTTKPLLVVNTHGHSDHAGGNYQFKTVYVHPADFGAARQVGTPEARARATQAMARGKTAPDMVTAEDVSKAREAELLPVKDGFVFDLGGRKLEVIETPGHTAGEIVLLDAANKQAFTGDNDNGLVWLFLPTCLPLEVYLESLKKLERRAADFATIYPGHGAPLPATFVSEQVKCVESILDGTCHSEPYKSFAGNAVTCKYGSAVVAFDPKNLRARR